MIYIFISSDPVFFVLEEDGLLDDSEFKDGFDSTSALSVRVLQLPLRGHCLERHKNVHGFAKELSNWSFVSANQNPVQLSELVHDHADQI